MLETVQFNHSEIKGF